MNVRGEVHAYLVPEDYRRLRLEALARGVSLSRGAADCLAEYFALRQKMATAIETETPDQAGTLAPSRVIHVLLAQTEQRLVATLDRYADELVAVRGAESPKPLWEEMHDLQVKRNAVLHQATSTEAADAQQAIAVAEALLRQVFPTVLTKLGLHLHAGLRACDSPECTPPVAGA